MIAAGSRVPRGRSVIAACASPTRALGWRAPPRPTATSRGHAAAAPASTGSRDRSLAVRRAPGVLQLSRGAIQSGLASSFLAPSQPRLVQGVEAQKPESTGLDVGTLQTLSRCLAPATAYPPPLAQRAVSPSSPEAGAVCGNTARTDLCGGCLVRGIPTATRLPLDSQQIIDHLLNGGRGLLGTPINHGWCR